MQRHSYLKVMLTVFWDRKGILLMEYLERGKTMNSDDYYSNPLKQLRNKIKEKRHGKLGKGIFLLHDNAMQQPTLSPRQLTLYKHVDSNHCPIHHTL